MARGRPRLSNRIHQERGPVHELITDILPVHILAKIHYQRPHGGVILGSHLPRERVNVWQQAIAQGVVLNQNLLRFGTVRPQLVFIWIARAVNAENWGKGSELE